MEIRLKLFKIFSSPLSFVFIVLFLSAKGHLEIIDTEYSVRTAIALVEDGSMLIDLVCDAALDIAHPIKGTDKIYSQYGLGLVVIFLPIVIVGKLISVVLAIDQRIIIDFLISFYNIPFALLGLYFFKSIYIRLGISKSTACSCTVILFCCTGFWKYSVTDFSEITQVAFLLGAINSLLLEKSSKWKHVSFWLALLVMMKLIYVLLLPIFFLYSIWSETEKISAKIINNRFSNFCLFLLPTGLFLAFMNHIRFGSVFETGYGSQATLFSFEFFRRDWFDYIFSMQRGILPFNPILLFSTIGWFFLPNKNRKFFFIIMTLKKLYFYKTSIKFLFFIICF